MTVGIYHLVRAANGIEPFRRFVRSLRAAPPAEPWTLELIFKGFGEVEPYLAEVAELRVGTTRVDDSGVDISSYFAAAAATTHEVGVFFNSFCEIVERDWFAILANALAKPGIGLVGTTGSLESVVRNHLIYAASEASPIKKATKYAMAAGLLAMFPPFPNPHVRTNAFIVRRADFLATNRFPVKRRLAALFYESGWLSLTRQIQRRGLGVLVADRHGNVFEPDAWADARTFRSGDQENALVRDNRTAEYANATLERRSLLRRLAFGDHVRS